MSRLRGTVTHPIFITAVVFALLPFVLPRIGSTVSLGTEIVLYTLYGIGYNLLLGYTGLVSFGPSAYFGMAAYAAGLAQLHLASNVYLAMLMGTLAAGVTGVALGALILRRRGLYFSLLTLAFTQLFYEIAFQWTPVTGGENGLQGMSRPGLENALVFHVFCSGVVIVAIYLLWRVVHSPFGRVLQAIRENEQRARCLGYNTHRYKLVAFVFSATFMGLAGSLLTFLIQGVYADVMSWQHAGDPVLMTVLGGMHHFLGPLWGAFTFILLRDQLSSFTEHWWLFFGGILIAFILLSPEGLSGIFSRLRRGARWNLTRTVLPPRSALAPVSDNREPAAKGDQHVLSVRTLSKRFGQLVVADGINLDLRQGEIHSLIGPNGAGKTTFFNMVTGLVPRDAGQILFNQREVGSLPPHQRVDAGIGRSFQILSVFKNLTVFENVRVAVQARSNHRFAFWRNAYAFQPINERTWSILDSMGLSEHADKAAIDLPHGEQRLLEIAITIATDPEILLLDEPLAGLGHEDRERISALIRQLSGRHSILVIEHDIDRVLAISDRITILHQGRVIAQGGPQEVMNQPEVVTAYLGRKPPSAAVQEIGIRRARSRATAPILKLKDVVAGYEGSSVLRDVNLEVSEGEIVALLGRNGVGKTTTLRTIIGSIKPMAGAIEFDGQQIGGRPPYRINRLGISVVPEGRRIFPNLTVRNNLQLAQRSGGRSVQDAFELFPRLQTLQDSKGETLSGGELQMLAIARALMAPTKLMLLDEPLEGLAPGLVNEVVQAIGLLRGQTSILIVEQNDLILQMADRAYVMVSGQIAYAGDAEALRQDEALQVRLLGV
jgi:ABC-type branched-subunit amino acid transport system ATPase component/ABC-type branched-subunit amino acid transport system permease subunit